MHKLIFIFSWIISGLFFILGLGVTFIEPPAFITSLSFIVFAFIANPVIQKKFLNNVQSKHKLILTLTPFVIGIIGMPNDKETIPENQKSVEITSKTPIPTKNKNNNIVSNKHLSKPNNKITSEVEDENSIYFQNLHNAISKVQHNSKWDSLIIHNASKGNYKVNIIYKIEPDNYSEVKKDTSLIAKTIVLSAVKNGEDPRYFLFVHVWAKSTITKGVTGQELVKIYGHSDYSGSTDSITFKRGLSI